MNIEYMDVIIESVENARGCSDLQEIYNDFFITIKEQIEAVKAQIEKFAVLEALLQIPKTPDEVVEWIEKFITEYLMEMVSPATKFKIQLAILLAKLIELQQKIEDKQAIFDSCKIDFSEALDIIGV